MPLPTGARLGSYEIRGPIGAGGMGEVYRAWDARLGREVAVKVLPPTAAGDPERLRRFEQEARAAGALNHPNVLAVHDVGTHEAIPYIVSELLEGETLRTQISAGGLTPRKALEHGVQIARGLSAAHQRGIVHRDLKPENVYVTRDGHVKILDFGLAKLLDDGPSGPEARTATHQTRAGVILGTVPYLSPEQVRGLPADARSDVFALGAVLYEMLARRRAFTGETAAEVETAILRTEPPELMTIERGISPAVDRVVRRCLEKRPEERFQTAQDVAFALEAVGAGVTMSSPHVVVQGLRRGRWRALLALLGGFVLGLPAGGLLLATLRPAPTPPVYTQLTFARGSVLAARFAHDGQRVVYSAAWDGQPAQVYTTRIGRPESRALGIEGVVLAVSSRGEVAVKRGRFLGRRSTGREESGTLAVVPLEGGAPRDLLDDVSAADWDAVGNELAVVRRVDGKKRLEFPIGHVLYEGDVFNVRVLPANRVVTLEARQHPNVGSWSFDLSLLDREGRKKVISPGWRDWPMLSWSETTREILFVSSRADDLGLWAVDLDGRERLVARALGDFDQHDVDARGRVLLERMLRRSHVVCLPPGEAQQRDLTVLDGGYVSDLSLDGQQLLLRAYGWDQHDTEAAFLRKADGSAPVRLGDYNGQSLSPDGRLVLAFPRGEEGSDRLVLVPTGAGEGRELRHEALPYIDAASWFPDGKRIALLADVRIGPGRLFVWDVDNSVPPRPLSQKERIVSFVVSPDGRFVAAAVADRGVVLYPVDGGASRALSGATERDHPLRWSSDGRWLFVSRIPLPAANASRVWIDRIEVATGVRQPWRELIPGGAGVRSIVSVAITPDGKGYAYSYSSILSSLYLAERQLR